MGADPRALTIDHLAVRRPGGRLLVGIEDLVLAPGAMLGVRGPSGAGKSTLLYALGGLLPCMEGAVRWGDHDLSRMRPRARTAFRARHMGFVFQDFMLVEELDPVANASVQALFRPRAARPAIRDRARALLSGLGVPQERRGAETFSGGERQRIAVARALSGGAGILLADEPTASLDRAAADRLVDDLVARVREGSTTLVAVSHDETLLERMDRVVTLAAGRMEPTHA